MKMLFLLANANIPFGLVTSTARKGRKWFDAVTAGDELAFHFTETGEQFGRAAVIGCELITFAQIVERAKENYDGSEDVLRQSLSAAYGDAADEDEFTMVKFIRLNVNVNPRTAVYAAVDSERDYQEALKDTAGKINDHEIPAYLNFMDDYLVEARHISARDWSDDCGLKTLHKIRAVVALGVACMEVHGAPRRTMPDSEKLAGRVESIR